MADKRITDLPELIQADNGDFIPIVDSSMNITKRVAAEKVLPSSSVDLGRLNSGSVAGTLVSNGSGGVAAVPSAYGQAVTLSSGTGTKTLTGFGFRPREVQFISNYSSTSIYRMSVGGAVDLGGGSFFQYVSVGFGAGAGFATESMTVRCIRIVGAGASLVYAASFISFDSDGVTIQVHNDDANFRTWFVIARP